MYNRYLIEYLRRAGLDVTYHGDPGDLTEIEAADVVIVDSLVIGQTAPRLLSLSAPLVLLLHVFPSAPHLGPNGNAVLESLCRRSRLVVTGDPTLAAMREILLEENLDAIKIEPGIPEDWPAKKGYAGRARQLLSVANYVRGKGILRLLDVLLRLRDLPWTLTLHGNRELDPAYYAAVTKRIEEFGLSDRIELLGPVPHRAINERMRQSDLLVHFSQYESYSMVTAEAIACGLPVLSYRTGNFEIFGRSGLVRYLDGDGSSEPAWLGALIDDEGTYSQLRPSGSFQRRSWNDVGREFLGWLASH